MNVSLWLKQATTQLNDSDNDSDSASLDAELLLCHVLGWNRAKLYTWPNEPLSTDQLNVLGKLLTRRENGEPIAYIIGNREFYSLELDVSPAVLVPRPDTELIVDLALAELNNGISGYVLDAGTGSGAIAIAVAHEWQAHTKTANHKINPAEENLFFASDYSPDAIKVAQHNAHKHKLQQINFVRSDWLEAFRDNTFGMIISNPPYIAADDCHLQNLALQHEPQAALVSQDNGLSDIQKLIAQALRAGKPGCLLLIEHGSTQAGAVQSLMQAQNYTSTRTCQDIAGLDRVTSGYTPNN